MNSKSRLRNGSMGADHEQQMVEERYQDARAKLKVAENHNTLSIRICTKQAKQKLSKDYGSRGGMYRKMSGSLSRERLGSRR